jgi:NAD(P)-dependent dehydrogenase (short-subunit alcohol dehydrogenase family)
MSKQDLPNLSSGALFGLDGKVVVVTGGGTGLGLMMATAFVQNGAKIVYICSRKLKNLETAANTLNSIRSGVCVPLEANLTTAQGCKDLASEIAKRESTLDVLVNNSGVSWGSAIDKVDEVKGWDRVFDVNTKSIFYLTVALLPLLKKDASINRPASVINISCVEQGKNWCIHSCSLQINSFLFLADPYMALYHSPTCPLRRKVLELGAISPLKLLLAT